VKYAAIVPAGWTSNEAESSFFDPRRLGQQVGADLTIGCKVDFTATVVRN
jgi:hypothetical protein